MKTAFTNTGSHQSGNKIAETTLDMDITF